MRLTIFYLFLFTISLGAFAQITERTLIEGQIIVPPGDDPEGIVVYNQTSGRGTISNADGSFYISVVLNDKIYVQSLQYTPFTIIVDNGIMSSKRIAITLRESINTLEEVVVTPYDLSGNITADVNRVNTRTEPRNIQAREVVLEDRVYAPITPVDNIAIEDEEWRYGLNFVNIYKALVGKRKENPREFQLNARDELVLMYDNTFFQSNLGIERENIGDFLIYTENNGLNEELLKPGNELNLMSFLLEKRDDFYEQRQKK